MYTDNKVFLKALDKLKCFFGEIDNVSMEYSFSDFSHFYDSEMNGIVLKRLISFKKLVDPSRLSEIKLLTNDFEQEFSLNEKRNVNIDPCLLSHGKFVMATTKGASFRIPLINGIYGDLSLVYSKHKWVHFYWTYFDIKSDFVKGFLEKVRQIYLEQRKT